MDFCSGGGLRTRRLKNGRQKRGCRKEKEEAMALGYAGKILEIDLTRRSVRIEPTDAGKEAKYIGGFGSCYRLAYEHAVPGTDPLAPENPIIFSPGVLAGTPVPGAVKITAVSRLPLTGTFGWSQGSMAFAAMLKFAGYDHVVVTGRSEQPVYLRIVDDEVTFCDATGLWGKDILDATAEIKKGYEKSSVVCIGLAGEKLSKLSLALIDGISTLGQGGLGAVMGAKNLKAVLVYGTKGVKVADREKFSGVVNGLSERFYKFKHRDIAIQLGMMAGWKALVAAGYISTRHLSEKEVTEIYGIEQYKNMKVKRVGCPGCLVADKDVVKIHGGDYDGMTMPVTSYQEIPAFAATFAIRDAAQATYLMNICNRYGISVQTLEGLLDFILDLTAEGIITPSDLDGLQAGRDFETIRALVEMIVHRKGAGDIFADGWKAIIDVFGRQCEQYAYINKGINFVWDPRNWILGTMEFAQIVSPKGPYSAFGGSPTTVAGLKEEFFKRHCDRVGASAEQIDRIFDSSLGINIGRMSRCFEDWVTILTSLGICNRAQNDRYYSAGVCADLYSAATGVDMSREDIVKAADRIWTVTRAINVREGFAKKDDTIPHQWFRPLRLSDGERVMRDYFGHKVLERADVEKWRDDYYLERGWDVEYGIPTGARLDALGLEDIKADMEKQRKEAQGQES